MSDCAVEIVLTPCDDTPVVEVIPFPNEPTITILTPIPGPAGISFILPIFSWSGELEVATGLAPFIVPWDMDIDAVVMAVGFGQEPLGDDIIADVNLDNVTIFPTIANRPRILAGQQISTFAIPDVTFAAQGQLITPDIVQIGSIFPGAEFTLEIIGSRA